MATKIESVICVIGREKVSIPVQKSRNIKHLEVKLSNGVSFDVEIDADGDIVITGSEQVCVMSENGNELIFRVEKSS
jgi:hypothetical protein